MVVVIFPGGEGMFLQQDVLNAGSSKGGLPAPFIVQLSSRKPVAWSGSSLSPP